MPESDPATSTGVLFVGATRYALPLPSEGARKFRLIGGVLGAVHVVASSSDAENRTFEAEGVRFYLHRRYSRWRRTVGRLLWSARQVRRILEESEVDVVVAQSPYEGVAALWAIRRAEARSGRPIALVVEAHADFEKAAGLQFGRGAALSERLMQGLLRAVVSRADAVRVVSPATDDLIARIAPHVPRVQFLPWTDIDIFLEATASKDDARVLYAGVLTPLKNVHTLMAAFAQVAPRHPQAHLTLVGAVENEAYLAGLRQQARDLGIEDRYTQVAQMPQADLAARMAGAAVLVLPSFSEGLGRVVFEAMATGTPVIGANVGGIPGMIQPGVTGWLFDPHDPAALAAHLDDALGAPERTRAMGEAARAFARAFFSTEHYLSGLSRLVSVARERAASRFLS